ncbi:MAG: MerR family transcriptional regulator [candidate division Zixibacteria bacterium]|nr:MerR family transcriptional regulator [candidate division Zixibacteria bacterium]
MGHLDIEEVASIFDKSVRVMRDYKRLGIIQPVRRDGMKDFYDRDEVDEAKRRIDALSVSKNLSEIAEIVARERRKMRRA